HGKKTQKGSDVVEEAPLTTKMLEKERMVELVPQKCLRMTNKEKGFDVKEDFSKESHVRNHQDGLAKLVLDEAWARSDSFCAYETFDKCTKFKANVLDVTYDDQRRSTICD
ncbi:hypothetical protein HPP92_026074, partial [Vanilla planifolia]